MFKLFGRYRAAKMKNIKTKNLIKAIIFSAIISPFIWLMISPLFGYLGGLFIIYPIIIKVICYIGSIITFVILTKSFYMDMKLTDEVVEIIQGK